MFFLKNHNNDPPIFYSIIFLATYLVLALFYIVLSTDIVFQIAKNTAEMRRFEQIKGFSFIFVTGIIFSIILFFLLKYIYNAKAQLDTKAQTLTLHQHNFELLFFKNPLPTWVFDLKSLKFLAINQAMIDHYGFSAEEFKQINIYDIHPKEEANLLKQLLQQRSVNAHFSDIKKHQNKNGQQFEINLTAHYINFMGHQAILMIVLDMSKQIKLENLLYIERSLLMQRVREHTADLQQENTELLHALQIRDEFLAGMSHELRTPLNVIITIEEALSDGVYGTVMSKQTRPLSTIRENAYHLLSLINNILDVSKIEAGYLILNDEQVKVADLCYSVIRLMNDLAISKKISLKLDHIDESLFVRGDNVRLKQIFVNLLSNAIKFTPEYGQVGIHIHCDQAQETIQLTVWDTGIGIQEQDFDKLFQPFIQLESALARHCGGTGLGLTLVQHLVTLHHGHITVKSKPNKGSCFTVTLPWSNS